MNKQVYSKYTYLSRNKNIYQKLLKINNLKKKENYINSIYYPITDTTFLVKSMYHELGNYKNIYKILINFNFFTMRFDIKFYKIVKKRGCLSVSVISETLDLRQDEFNLNFISCKLVTILEDINTIEIMPIILKCKKKLNLEYMSFIVLVYSIFSKNNNYLPNVLIKNIISYIL